MAETFLPEAADNLLVSNSHRHLIWFFCFTSFRRSSLSLSSSLATWTRFLTERNMPLSTGNVGMSSARKKKERFHRVSNIFPENVRFLGGVPAPGTYDGWVSCKSFCSSDFLAARWAWRWVPPCWRALFSRSGGCNSAKKCKKIKFFPCRWTI